MNRQHMALARIRVRSRPSLGPCVAFYTRTAVSLALLAFDGIDFRLCERRWPCDNGKLQIANLWRNWSQLIWRKLMGFAHTCLWERCQHVMGVVAPCSAWYSLNYVGIKWLICFSCSPSSIDQLFTSLANVWWNINKYINWNQDLPLFCHGVTGSACVLIP